MLTTPYFPLLSESGNFTIATSGNGYIGFFFQGDENFITRCINLCVNYGMLQSGKVHSYGDTSQYILVPPDRLKNGLKEYFKGEILKENLINKVYERDDEDNIVGTTWDEQLLEVLAGERVEEFLKEKVEYKNLLDYEGGYYPNMEYSRGSICAEKE